MIVKIDFQTGQGFQDISNYVIPSTFRRDETLFDNLRPKIDTVYFNLDLRNNITLYNQFFASQTIILLQVYEDNGTTFIFNGIIRPNFRSSINVTGISELSIEGIDNTYKLEKKVSEATYANYKVCNISNKAQSLVHVLLYAAGLTDAEIDITSNILTDIPVFNLPSDVEIKTILADLLSEYGYLYRFTANGKFTIFKYILDSITTSNILNDSNLSGIETPKSEWIEKGVNVKWRSIETLTNTLLANDTTNGTGTVLCDISVNPLSYYPPNANATQKAYLAYNVEGRELLYAYNVTSDFVYESGITVTRFNPEGKQADIALYNGNVSLSKKINKLQIKGTAILVKSEDITTVNPNLVSNYETIETKYIFDKVTAKALADYMYNYRKNTSYKYTVKSTALLNVGDLVKIQTTKNNLDVTGRIVKKVVKYNDYYVYEIEQVGSYIINPELSIVSKLEGNSISSQIANVQTVVQAGLNETGTLAKTINSNTMITDTAPNGDGLYLTKTYIGLYKDGGMKVYIKNDGTFQFTGNTTNKILWDNSKLQIYGDLYLSGSSTIAGNITAGQAIKSSNYAAGSAGFNIGSDGAAEFNNVIARGTIYASAGSFTGSITSTSGTIGGFTINASTIVGGSLTLASSGNITAGTSNNVIRISADDATYRLWIGNATAASAPFRVSAAGALTATNATITGTITSSNLTATGGTVGGFTLASTTLTGGSLVLTNTGNLTAGTVNNVIRISADDATYRLWIGNAVAASAPFRVSSGGALTATGANITGTITTGALTATGGTIGGITLASSKLYTGVGTYNSADTGFYLDSTGQLSLKDKLAWNGTTLSVNGSITTDSITATGGTIGGINLAATKLYTGVGTFNSADTGFYLDNAGQLSLKDKLAWNGTTLSINGTITTSAITATGGTVGGFTLASTTLTGGSLILTNTGNITAGTSNNVIRISANDATYRLWIGNATAASAPFRVSYAGALTATNATITGTITSSNATITGGTFGGMSLSATELKSTNFVAGSTGFSISNTGYAEFNEINVRGNVNSTSGSIGGWLLTTDKLTSALTGSRITLDSGLSRVSIYDSLGAEKVVMGYLSGLAKNSGIGTYTSSDYGFWVAPGESVKVDGPISMLNGDMTATDGAFKVLSGTTELARLGTDSAVNGLHLYNTNGRVSLSNPGVDALQINTDNGYVRIGANNTSWTHFYTDRANYYFDKGLHAVLGFTVYNTGYGIDSTGKGKFLSGTGTDSNTVYIKDSNNQLKERTIPSVAWTNTQELNTGSAVTFATVNGLTISTVSGKTLNLANASLTVGDATGTGTITLKSDSATNRVITAQGDAILVTGTMVPTSRTIAGKALSADVTLDTLTLTPTATRASVVSNTYNGNGAKTFYIYEPGQDLETTNAPTFGGLTLSGAVPILYLTETDQTDPAGRYRLVADGDTVTLRRAQTAATWTGERTIITASNTGVAVYNGSGADSNTVYIKDGAGRLKERAIPAVAWTNTQATNTTSNVTFGTITGSTITGSSLIIATSYGFDSTGKAEVLSGTGTDSNTVYIKDSNSQLKERAIPAVAWTNTQATNTTSNVTFGTLQITSGVGANSNTVYIKDGAGQLKERTIPAVAWTNTQALNASDNPTFNALTAYSVATSSINVSGFIYGNALLSRGADQSTGINANGRASIGVYADSGNSMPQSIYNTIGVAGSAKFKIMVDNGTTKVDALAISSTSISDISMDIQAKVSAPSITATANLRIPTAQPSTLANGDIWMV